MYNLRHTLITTELQIYTDIQMKNKIDLIYKDLTYKIIGVLFEVYNKLGYGYQEKYYQKAIAALLKKRNVKFREQIYVPLMFNSKRIGKYFLDFLIEDKIVLEIKKSGNFQRNNIEQIYAYLKASGLKLGILANFTKTEVKIKRIANIQ